MEAFSEDLNDEKKWNNLSFFLRRYLYQVSQQKVDEQECANEEKKKCLIDLKDIKPYAFPYKGKKYNFPACNPKEELTENDVENYAELLFRLTCENIPNRTYNMSTRNKKRLQISKDEYIRYMNGTRTLGKDAFFKIAYALKMAVNDVHQLALAIGRSPAFNYRSITECIHYFCISLGAPITEAYAIIEEIEETESESDTSNNLESYREFRYTTIIQDNLNKIINNAVAIGGYQTDSYTTSKKKFLNYLKENRNAFIEVSNTRRNILGMELCSSKHNRNYLLDVLSDKLVFTDFSELIADKEITITQDEIEKKIDDVNVTQEIKYFEEAFAIQDSASKKSSFSREKEGNYSFYYLTGIEDVENFESISTTDYSGIWRERLLTNFFRGDSLRKKLYKLDNKVKENVNKYDILMVRGIKFYEVLEQIRKKKTLTADEAIKMWNYFYESTNNILCYSGLPQIYLSDPFDNMILTMLSLSLILSQSNYRKTNNMVEMNIKSLFELLWLYGMLEDDIETVENSIDALLSKGYSFLHMDDKENALKSFEETYTSTRSIVAAYEIAKLYFDMEEKESTAKKYFRYATGVERDESLFSSLEVDEKRKQYYSSDVSKKASFYLGFINAKNKKTYQEAIDYYKAARNSDMSTVEDALLQEIREDYIHFSENFIKKLEYDGIERYLNDQIAILSTKIKD